MKPRDLLRRRRASHSKACFTHGGAGKGGCRPFLPHSCGARMQLVQHSLLLYRAHARPARPMPSTCIAHVHMFTVSVQLHKGSSWGTDKKKGPTLPARKLAAYVYVTAPSSLHDLVPTFAAAVLLHEYFELAHRLQEELHAGRLVVDAFNPPICTTLQIYEMIRRLLLHP